MSGNTSQRLIGCVAVVTGGAQGIGFGIASRLAAEGAILVIADINEKNAREAPQHIMDAGGTASAFAVDIGDDARVAALAAHVDAQHGRCEILVNNAAISDGTGIEAMTMARYHEVTRVNQDGAVRMSLAFVPLLKKAGEGRRILNIASIMGVRGWPNAIPYSTAKGGSIGSSTGRVIALRLVGVDHGEAPHRFDR